MKNESNQVSTKNEYKTKPSLGGLKKIAKKYGVVVKVKKIKKEKERINGKYN